MNFKILISILIIFIFLISLVNSLELGISPGNIYLKGKVGEIICKNFSIQSNYNGNIIGETRWIRSQEKNKNILDYDLKPEDLGLSVDYPDKIKTSNGVSIKEQLCINATRPGTYYGALTYKTEEGYAGVGSWITVDIPGQNTFADSLSFMRITGLFIGNGKTGNKYDIISSIVISVFFMLIIMLFVLLYVKKKIKN